MQKQEEEGVNRVFRRDRITLGFDLWLLLKVHSKGTFEKSRI